MSILIIALPRTGSSELGKNLSKLYTLDYLYEPFDPLKGITEINIDKNTLIKTMVFRAPVFIKNSDRIQWLIEFTKQFDQTILLSRKNLTECAESWSYLLHHKKLRKFRDNFPYFWEKTPNYDEDFEFIKNCQTELEIISDELNIPITYYEDIYDPNDDGRLRKGNRNDIGKKIF
jgi:hypothetical protein